MSFELSSEQSSFRTPHSEFKKPLRLLIIEDSEDDTLLLLRELRRGGYEPVFERVETADKVKAAIEKQKWDLIISDYVLPKLSGLDALSIFNKSGLDLPFIVVSGNIGEDIAVGTMIAGAHDYILKGNLKRLVPAIERELREAGVRRERREVQAELRRNYEALQKNEKSLAEAQRIANLGNWDWDLRTNELHWSDEVYRIFGLDPARFEKTYVAFLNYVHPDDRESVKKAINDALYERKPYSIEHRIILEDGTLKIVHEQGEVSFTDGEPTRLVGTVQDVTERKIQEEKLRNSREQLRNLSAHLHTVREQERTSIAREIHDELGQALTALKMDIAWLGSKCKDNELFLDKATTMLQLIDSTIKTVKRISSELRPVMLDDLGLIAAIEWQAGEFQKRTGIVCDVHFSPGDIILDKAVSTTIFRIFQEALTNVIRHAGATKVTVRLEEKDGQIFLFVKDNGKGITEEQKKNPGSFGLIGIRERVHFFGGEAGINGGPGKGTTLSISIPLVKEGKTGVADV